MKNDMSIEKDIDIELDMVIHGRGQILSYSRFHYNENVYHGA
jgi:hypothetical protein